MPDLHRLFLLQIVNLCAWTFSLFIKAAIVLAHHPFFQIIPKSTPLEYGLHETYSHVAWSAASCYIIFACAHDSGGVINWFLSLPMWQPLSKLSYAIYLIHCVIIGITVVPTKTQAHFSELAVIQDFFLVFMVSVFVAIPLVLAIELPIDAINKLTMGSKNGQKLRGN